jgi:hypothetical protein
MVTPVCVVERVKKCTLRVVGRGYYPKQQICIVYVRPIINRHVMCVCVCAADVVHLVRTGANFSAPACLADGCYDTNIKVYISSHSPRQRH